MEPPERENIFERYRGEGWESEYLQYRKDWSAYPAKQYVADYPLLVDLELSTLCNLRCPMCYTITEEYKAKVNACLMDFELFKRIVTEIKGKVPALRLSLRGEPTLHPRFVDCVAFAKQSGIKEVSTLTNGSTLTPEFVAEIVTAGIDWITISVDGLDGRYESIRRPLKFADTLAKIKQIHAFKKREGLHRPVLKIQAVWPSIKEDPETFYNTFAPYVDLIAFNPLIDYLGKDEDIVYEDDFYCCQHYQRLVVGADGRVMMCSNDEEASVVVGDVNRQSIHEIWQGEALNHYRQVHAKKDGFMEVPVCRRCYLPRRTEDCETAVVNGREFIIKNYVNRKQQVGQ